MLSRPVFVCLFTQAFFLSCHHQYQQTANKPHGAAALWWQMWGRSIFRYRSVIHLC